MYQSFFSGNYLRIRIWCSHGRPDFHEYWQEHLNLISIIRIYHLYVRLKQSQWFYPKIYIFTLMISHISLWYDYKYFYRLWILLHWVHYLQINISIESFKSKNGCFLCEAVRLFYQLYSFFTLKTKAEKGFLIMYILF